MNRPLQTVRSRLPELEAQRLKLTYGKKYKEESQVSLPRRDDVRLES